MTEEKISEFASKIGQSVEFVVDLLNRAGITGKSGGDSIDAQEKGRLLKYMRNGGERARAAPRRRAQVERVSNKTSSGSGTVTVITRRRKRPPRKPPGAAAETAAAPPAQEAAPEAAQAEAKAAAPAAKAKAKDAAATGAPQAEPQVEPQTEPQAAQAEPQAKPQAKPRAKPPAKSRAKPKTAAQDAAPEAAPQTPQAAAPKSGAPAAAQDAAAAEQAAAPAADAKRETPGAPARKRLTVSPQGDRRKPRSRRRMPGRKIDQPRRNRFVKPVEPVKREVQIPETIAVSKLAERMAIKSADLIKQLMDMGVMATVNQMLDQETAILVVEELGHTPRQITEAPIIGELEPDEPEGELAERPPVVTVMGHVDHGKTTLLDYIRKSQVAAGEAGGITQHIGAYHVETPKGVITFLDTPGHAAFEAMRARGSRLTDIIALVVAADDGVQPQTVEAIGLAAEAKVPLIVALNKTDKPEADIEKIRNELSQHGIVSEDWGGDHIFVEISAKTGEGVDALLDAILLQAEMRELRAAASGAAKGVIIESTLDKGRGPMATMLVQRGCLRKGDILLAGTEYGRVRILLDEQGRTVESASPSMPAVVLGLSGTPEVGSEALVVSDERRARDAAKRLHEQERERLNARPARAAPESFADLGARPESGVLNVLIKADMRGSVEALRAAVEKLGNEDVRAEVIASGIGGITASDIHRAATSGATVIGFNVRADAQARKAMRAEERVQILYYSVIYEALEDVRKMMEGMLEPELKERIIGTAKVLEVFTASGFGQVAGCLVEEGAVRRGNPIRVLRESVVIYEGELESLRRFKDDVAEVAAGSECGIAVKNYRDVRADDQIEVYERIEVKREL